MSGTDRRPYAGPPALPLAALVAAVAVAIGYATAVATGASFTLRMLPWIAGRGLGLAAYVALVLLTATGLWLRHPARARVSRPSPSTLLWVHASSAAATLVLVLGHVVALALDSYAGVGWAGTFVPGASAYRPLAVGLGTVGLYVGLLTGGAVVLAGRIVGRHWLRLHRLASAAFVLIWCHGVLAGTDTTRLRALYLVSGVAIAALAISRRVMRPAPGTQESPAL
jgi:methionine sulfoxide reductase heme-binding subunit